MSNTTRRNSLRSSAAALIAGIAAPALADSLSGADMNLFVACREATYWEERRCFLNQVNGVSDGEMTAMNQAWHLAFQRVAELPATTQAGVLAKVTIARMAVCEFVIIGADHTMEDGDLHDRLAVSLFDDIMAGVAG